MKKNTIVNYILLIGIFGFSNSSCTTEATKQLILKYKNEGYVKAKIIDHSKLDGCGFMMELEDHKMLQPMELPIEFQKDNLKIWLKYQVPKKSPMGFCMAGKMVNIIDIKLRDE